MSSEQTVSRLDFASNLSEIVAQVTAGLRELQSTLDATGRAGTKGQIGQGVLDGLAQVAAGASDLGSQIEATVRKAFDGFGSLNNLPKASLGANFNELIGQLTAAQDQLVRVLDGTSRRQIGTANLRQQLVAPVEAMLNQLRDVQRLVEQRMSQMSEQQAAQFRTLANPGQITRAIGTGQAYIDNLRATDQQGRFVNPLPTYVPPFPGEVGGAQGKLNDALDAAAKATQRLQTASNALAGQQEVTKESLRAYDEWLQEQINSGNARPFANGYLIPEADGTETFHTRPSPQSLVEQGQAPADLTDAGTDRVQAIADEQAAYKRDTDLNRQARQREIEARQRVAQIAQQRASDEADARQIEKRLNDQAAAELARRFQAGLPGVSQIGKSNFFEVAGSPSGFGKLTTAGISTQLGEGEVTKALNAFAIAARQDEAAARRLAQMYDQANTQMQQSINSAKERAAGNAGYAQLLANSPKLDNIETLNPGNRVIGQYVQLGTVLQKQTAAGLRDLEGQQELYSARAALARSLSTNNSGNAAGSVFDAFLGGAFGHGFDTHASFDPSQAFKNLASTAGVLARYGYEFKLIQDVLNGLKDSFTNLGAYQVVMTQLDEIIKTTGADSVNMSAAFTDSTNVAVNANQAYQIGTQAISAYQNELKQGVSSNTIFTRSVEAVGQAMILTGQNADEAQRNLIASTNSFGQGSGGQSRVLDAVVNAYRNFGGNQSDILSALSTSAASAQESGVSPEQLANIVSLIQAHTGDSGTTIASTFDRLVNRQDNGTFVQALNGAGISNTGNLAQEITQLSTAYNSMSRSEQEAFTASLGGARNMKDLLPLLQYGAQLGDANAKSMNGQGAAADQTAKQMATLAGQLQQIKALFVDVTTNLGRSGIFEGVTLALATIKPVLEGVNELLTAFNALVPNWARGVLGVATDVALLVKGIELMKTKFAGGITATVTGKIGNALGAAGAENPVAQAQIRATESLSGSADALTAAVDKFAVGQAGATAVGSDVAALSAGGAAAGDVASRTAQDTGAGAAPVDQTPLYDELIAQEDRKVAERSALASAAGSVTGSLETEGALKTVPTAAKALLGLAGSPVTWAIGGLFAVGALSSHAHDLRDAMDKGSAALTDLSKAKTSSDFQTAADNLKTASDQAKKASSGIVGHVSSVLFGNPTGRLNDEANYAQSIANRLSDQSSNVSTLGTAVFGPSGADLTAGLAQMKQQGVDATTQLKAVAQALGLVRNAADTAAAGLAGPGQEAKTGLLFNDQFVANLAAAAANGKTLNDKILGAQKGAYSASDTLVNLGGAGGLQNFSLPKIKDADKTIRSVLPGYQPGDVINDADKAAIARALSDSVKFTKQPAPVGLSGPALKQWKTTVAQGQQQVRDSYYNAVLGQLGGLTAKDIAKQTGSISDQTLGSDLAGLAPDLQGAAKGNPLVIGSSAKALGGGPTSVLAILQGLKARATDTNGVNYQNLLQTIDEYKSQFIQARVGDLERLRQAAEARNVGNLPAIQKIRHNFFGQEIAASKADQNTLVQIFDQMSQSEINLFLAKYEQELKLAQAAVDAERRLLAAAQSVGSEDDPQAAHRQVADSSGLYAAQAKLRGVADTVKNLKVAAKNASPQDPSADPAVQAAQQAHIAYLQSLAQPGNQVSQDRAALAVAQYQLTIAKKNSADFYNAEKAISDAQYQLAKDQAEHATQLAHDQRLLKIDTTNPVAVAQEAARQAREQLASDLKRQREGSYVDPDQIAQDKEKVRDTGAAAQKAKFDQKMQDEQNLYDLQQISGAQYISFLEKQQSSLRRIKNKTRQQIDELTAVDQALKSVTDQMNGQWNLGNIKVPTPYEMRRVIQTGAAANSALYQTNTTQTITINVTGRAQMQDLLEQYLGKATLSRTGTTTKRVSH